MLRDCELYQDVVELISVYFTKRLYYVVAHKQITLLLVYRACLKKNS